MSLKDPNSKLIRWKIKLEEFNFEIRYKQGKLNANADALSRIKPSFMLIDTQENIFSKDVNLVHCISDDKMLKKGFAKQIDSKFQSKHFLENKNGNLIVQSIPRNKKLFHLTTKSKYYEKPSLNRIKICLNELKEYCIKNNIAELHMPRIGSGLDKLNFELIRKIILEIFEKTNIIIFVHEKVKEINFNDNSSVIVQVDENESITDQTVHSDSENELNNVLFKESSINVGQNQIVMSVHEKETEVRIKKLFENQKQRLIVSFNKYNLNESIKNFIKEYLAPGCKYHCLIEGELHLLINEILMNNFVKGSYHIIKCEYILEDVESLETQTEHILNYHEGKTNHRGIQETYLKLKGKYYWPKMYNDIQRFINNCEICLDNKYERKPIQINDNLTVTPSRPFEKINIDTLTLEKKKYLTVIDQLSKHATVYYLKNLNATSIVDALIEYFNTYKVPDEITYDAGTEFNNNLVTELLKLYKIKPHVTCIRNPKSNGIIERFHSTLIEHLRIINQRAELKNVTNENKIKLAQIAYNDSINSVTKLTPKEVLFGRTKIRSPFKSQIINEDYLNNHQIELGIINDLVKLRIEKEKIKRNKTTLTMPENLPDKVKVKANKRMIQKIKKPLFNTRKVENYDSKLGVIKLKENKRYRIDKIKRPRRFAVTGT